MIFTRSPKPSMTTAEEAPTVTTEAPTTSPAPPLMYPRGEWAPAGDPFHVPEELRAAYASALPDPAREIGRREARGGFHSLRLVPRAKGERMVLDGQAEMPDFQPARGDDRIRVRVPVSPEEWLHLRRLELVEEQEQQRQRRQPRDVTACVACGETALSVAGSITPRTGAPYRLGIRGALCGACADVAVVVLAERTLPDGRTRRQAVAEVAGQGENRADADRAAVMALSKRG